MNENQDPYQDSSYNNTPEDSPSHPVHDPLNPTASSGGSGTGARLFITLGGLVLAIAAAVVLGVNIYSNYFSGDDSREKGKSSASKTVTPNPGVPGSSTDPNTPDNPPGSLSDLPDPPSDDPGTGPAGSQEVRNGDLAGKFAGVVKIPLGTRYMYYIGLYKNTGQAILRKPRLELQFLDGEGNIISVPKKNYGFGARGHLKPGESVPFRILARDVPEHRSWRIIHQPKKPFSAKLRLKLRIDGTRFDGPDRYGRYRVSGTITNRDDHIASLVKLIAVLYDAEGKICGHSTGYLQEKKLHPSKKSEFNFNINPVRGTPVKVVMDYTGWIHRGDTGGKKGEPGPKGNAW